MANLKYLGIILTNHNCIHEEIKEQIKYEECLLHSIHNFSPSHLLSKNLKFKIYKTIILFVVLYGYGTWFSH